jgi:hypothetical protein
VFESRTAAFLMASTRVMTVAEMARKAKSVLAPPSPLAALQSFFIRRKAGSRARFIAA